MPALTLSYDQFTLACHHVRAGLKSLYGDRYATEIDKHIALVRKVMKEQNLMPGDAAAFITQRGDTKTPWVFAAAMEIVDRDARIAELN